MLLWSLLAFVSFLRVACAAWGYTDNGSEYVIDSGASLVIKVNKSTGDITSLVYKSVEYQGYTNKNTQVESGLGASTVVISQVTSPANIIKVAVTHGTLKHYLFVRYGNNNVYIFTNKADDSISVQRYIVRMKPNIWPNNSTMTDYYDADCVTIESSGDVCQNGEGITKSKHYQGSNYGRTIDYDYVGKTTGTVGLWMIRSNHEKASGGPFFRSLLRRSGVEGEDLYDIYYYNMGITDPMRFGLQGPSVLAFTDGGTPSTNLFARNADWSWFDTLGIDGWVASSGRGKASGVGIASMKSAYSYTVGLSNSAAQYWGKAAASGGAWSISGILPGTYTMTVYKGELEVSTSSIDITAGATKAVNTITPSDPSDTTSIWRIGDWDGTPSGFRNFDTTPMKPTFMHPSDPRLSAWTGGNFIVGTSANNVFPGYMWNGINNNYIVYFKLTTAQLTGSHTIRIGITESYLSGRPNIQVNSWTSTAQASPDEARTRSLTVGTYRGNNHMFTYTVPGTAWTQSTTEWQTLTISIISGSTGSAYLSPGVSIDALDMI